MSASENNHPPKQGRGLSLPGQPTEEALAEVGSAAGNSLIRGFAKLGNAYVSEWTAKREAKAEAAHLAIGTDAKIKADTALATARREQEIAEFEHRAALDRRAARFRVEMIREQQNLEAIERRALEYTESAPENGNAREIDEDWIFKFADLAQKVSDRDVQSLWARALSSAAMQGRPKLSAAALQTLGLFDKHMAESFRRTVAAIAAVGCLPISPNGEVDTQDIDIALLRELGLIDSVSQDNDPFKFCDFAFEARPEMRGYYAYALTLRGAEIAGAVFRGSEDLFLSEEHEQQYLRLVLVQQFASMMTTIILPKLNIDRQQVVLGIKPKSATTQAIRNDWKTLVDAEAFSTRLRKLLLWAEEGYDIHVQVTN